MEELQKAINGKLVKFAHPKCLTGTIDAILIWPPGGKQISVKPYGYTPKELFEHMRRIGLKASLEVIKNPSFCLASHKELRWASRRELIQKIANLEENAIYNFREITGRNDFDPFLSVCPYG